MNEGIVDKTPFNKRLTQLKSILKAMTLLLVLDDNNIFIYGAILWRGLMI